MLQKLKFLSITIVFASLLLCLAPATSSANTAPVGGSGAGCTNSTAPSGTDCSTIPTGCPGSSLQGAVSKSSQLVCPFSPVSGSGYVCPATSCTYQDGTTSGDNLAPPDNGTSSVVGGNCQNVNKCDLLKNYINPFINLLSALVGVIVVISIIIGGIQYTTSAGDPQKASAARARIRNAIIALIAFIFLYSLLNFLIPGGLV